MGLMGLIKFALICIDFLAWPAIALGYPLYASIRAVETDSKYHLKKLVIYWTFFSLISLFEFVFQKIIVWIPFWDSIRLIAIIWLVMPHFNGAFQVYQSLVRPVLSVDAQAVIDKLYKPKEEKLCPRITHPDVVKQCIKENGSEALEKLITSKQECNNLGDILVLEPEEKNAAGISETAQYEDTPPPNAAAKFKETTPPETSAENRSPEIPPIKISQQTFTCDLCKVKTTSEHNINSHLRGRKHKSNCESLKARRLQAYEDTTPPDAAAKFKETTPPETSAANRRRNRRHKHSSNANEMANLPGLVSRT